MSPLKQRLQIVWNNKPPKRYLPKSLDGGTGWGAFDTRERRFMSNKEIKKVPTDTLLTETVTH